MTIFGGSRPDDLGVAPGGTLRACGSAPNCVCSDDERDSHHVAAFAITGSPDAAWAAVREAVAAMPRTTVVSDRGDYLHAECQSALMGFIDDLELHLRPDAGVVAVRSESRVGYGDMGVNRDRVEGLRAELARRGVVQGGGARER